MHKLRQNEGGINNFVIKGNKNRWYLQKSEELNGFWRLKKETDACRVCFTLSWRQEVWQLWAWSEAPCGDDPTTGREVGGSDLVKLGGSQVGSRKWNKTLVYLTCECKKKEWEGLIFKPSTCCSWSQTWTRRKTFSGLFVSDLFSNYFKRSERRIHTSGWIKGIFLRPTRSEANLCFILVTLI